MSQQQPPQLQMPPIPQRTPQPQQPQQQGTPQRVVQQQFQHQAAAQRAPQQPQQTQQPQQQVPISCPPPVEPSPPATLETSMEGLTTNGKVEFKKIFLKRKKSSVRTKEKKIRQNRQLRRSILPKNALMALNEVRGISMGDFVINANPSGGFSAIVSVNDRQYEGHGSSKMSAKTNACEKALRDYVLEKMRQKPRLRKTSQGDGNSVAGEPAEKMDVDDGDGKDSAETDDVPMINLASFAIFKLFSEWENEGFEVPEMHPAAGASNTPSESDAGAAAPKESKKAPIRTELPLNWSEMHPSTLLCMMRPGVVYNDCGTIGERPNTMQKIGVTVDGTEYIAYGRSKKSARRAVAVDVCNALFGTNFVKDDPAEA